MSKAIEQLKRAIDADPRTRRQICLAAGVAESIVCRLMSGERTIGFAAAERLAKALGLEITIGPAKPSKTNGKK